MNRAYSTLTLKAFDSAGRRRFTGIATTPAADRMGDVVEPKGAKFQLPLPLLWQHDAGQPIGEVTSARVTDKGIEIEGEVKTIDEPGRLQDRLTEAWQSLKIGLVRGLSIGFRALEDPERIKGTYGLRFPSWEWLELSAVTIPANQEASITTIKSIDIRQRAASGRAGGSPPPGVSGPRIGPPSGGLSVSATPKGTAMKTVQQLLDERAQKAARMNELVELKTTENRRFSADEAVEFDGLADDVELLDDDIRTAKAHAAVAARAQAVEGRDARSASQSRGAPTLLLRRTDPDEQFQGQSFVRRVIAKAIAAMNYGSAADVAAARWGKTHPNLVQWIKADVAGGGSGSGEWGAELVSADNRFTGDFITYLYGMTLFDQLPLRSVPANVTIKGQDGAATGYWVGESKAIGATTVDFSTVSLTPLKVGTIAVVSNELLRDSSPSAERLVRDALVEASAQKIDSTFFSTSAASAGVSPAGILNGVTIGASGGTTEAELIGDMMGLTRPFITAKYPLAGLVWVTTPLIAEEIAAMRNTLGQDAFASMSQSPMMLNRRRVYTGDNVATGDFILMSPGDIWKIGDGGVEVSISREATIEQNDAPAGATDTPVTMAVKHTNMFQSESTAIKVVRAVNWQKRRSGAVQYIGNASYGDINSV